MHAEAKQYADYIESTELSPTAAVAHEHLLEALDEFRKARKKLMRQMPIDLAAAFSEATEAEMRALAALEVPMCAVTVAKPKMVFLGTK